LHHYDRLGLLKAQRTDAGYRIYAERDLERLEQIVVLKFLGLSLRQIKVVLDRAAVELPDALRLQRQALEEKQRLLARALSAIVEAEKAVRPGEPTGPAVLKRLIEVIHMQDQFDELKRHYSDEQLTKLEQAAAKIRSGPIEEWKSLNREIAAAAAAGEDPAGEKAQAIGARYLEMMKRNAGRFQDVVQLAGDPEFRAAAKRSLDDKENWPAGVLSQIEGSVGQTMPFLLKVMAARPNAALDREEVASALLARPQE
jgi:MerR family transcriptional regulator, thiopeptide resistance regulator